MLNSLAQPQILAPDNFFDQIIGSNSVSPAKEVHQSSLDDLLQQQPATGKLDDVVVVEDAWGSEGIDIDGDLMGGSVDCLSTEVIESTDKLCKLCLSEEDFESNPLIKACKCEERISLTHKKCL